MWSSGPPAEGDGTQIAQNDRRWNSVPPRSALLFYLLLLLFFITAKGSTTIINAAYNQ